MSNVQYTVDNAVIRDNNGYLRIRQCKQKLITRRAISRHVQENNNKTPGDILNRLQYNSYIRDKILNK